MEATLNKTNVSCLKKVFESCFSHEETAESVVPDVLPDIAEIIDADGTVLLKSKEAEQGRITVSGVVNACVIYIPEGEGCAKKLGLTIPFTASAESAALSEATRPVASVKLVSMDARMLNPRKVLMRADLCVCLCGYEDIHMEICGGVEEEEEEEAAGSIHTLTSGCRVSPVTGVMEKTFVITDEYQIPVSKPVFDELYRERVDCVVEEVKTVGNKLVFKGSAHVGLLYASQGEGELASVNFSTSFSQIIELESMGEQCTAEIRLMLTGAYFEALPITSDGRMIAAELHFVAQAVCAEPMELNYIADAYSNAYELDMVNREVDMLSVERRMSLRETIRETLETPQAVREMVDAYPVTGVPEVMGKKVSCPVTICVLYRDEAGKLCSAEKKFTVETSLEVEAEMEIGVAGITCAEIYASAAVGGLEIRLPVDFEIMVSARMSINAIASIQIDTDNPINNCNNPSVTVIGSAGTKDIWKLAKKYCSTPELIWAANSLDELEGDESTMILIPRAR